MPSMPAYKKQPAAAGQAQASQTKKRKLDKNVLKYYAVRVGYRPGVYMTWADCEAQTTGFKGAQYKSFLTRDDALAFVEGKNPGGPSDQTVKWYGVAIGNKPGVYSDWAEAQKAYLGVKGPKYRKFLSRAEAEAYVRAFGNGSAQADEEDDEEDEDEDEDEEDEGDEEQPEAKKQKTTTAARSARDNLLHIYTDGSSRGNGKVGATAGLGVFFGIGDPRNISERLQGEAQTNQRAELMAILRALQTVDEDQGVRIYSDSKYSISCVTDWYRSWQKNDWRTREGEEVKNKDIIRPIRGLIELRDDAGAKTEFEWLRGHNGNAGNSAADQLAVAGAMSKAV